MWFCDREPVQDEWHRAQAGPATVIEQLCLCRTAAAIPSDEALQLSNVNIRLPWPDRYELTLNFGCHSQTASRSFSVSMAVASRDQRSTFSVDIQAGAHRGCFVRTAHCASPGLSGQRDENKRTGLGKKHKNTRNKNGRGRARYPSATALPARAQPPSDRQLTYGLDSVSWGSMSSTNAPRIACCDRINLNRPMPQN